MQFPLSIFLTLAMWFSGPDEIRREITSNWNKMAASMDRQTPALKRLEFSYQRNPPWTVYDAEEFKVRKESLRIAISEGEEQLRCLKKLRDAE